MKWILILILVNSLYSCDPDNDSLFNTEYIKINASIAPNTKEIFLGDTIRISALLPDSALTNNINTQINSLEKGHFYMHISKLDTISNTAVLLYPPIYWTSKGNISPSNSSNFLFNTNGYPYSVEINIKPEEKGIYIIGVVSQPGEVEFNNKYSANLVVKFNVFDRHIELAAPFLGTAWANDAQTREPGTFVFRVL